MNRTENNLLLSLHKWASRHDENFLTETFVHLLRHLLQYDPTAAVNILRQLTSGALNLTAEDACLVNITTQVTTSEGRPDIEVRMQKHLVYVEVKAESGADHNQLQRYRSALEKSGFDNTTLILLTRYAMDLVDGEIVADAVLRWYQIAEWLEHELGRETIRQHASVYVVEQFLGFLEGRNVTMEPVSWEFIRGVQSLRRLMEMLDEVLGSVKDSYELLSQFTSAWVWIGYLIGSKPEQYFIGIHYDRPHVLVFSTADIKIDESVREGLGVDQMLYGTWIIRELDLSSEEVHFFARPSASQLQCVKRFLVESLDSIKSTQDSE